MSITDWGSVLRMLTVQGWRDRLVKKSRDVPGSPVVKTSSSNAGGVGPIPGRGAKISHASWPRNQNIVAMMSQIQ